MRQIIWRGLRWFSQRSVLLTGLAYKAIFRLWEIQGRIPVVIYQMAKVGSSTVARSLNSSKKLAVFQVHNLRAEDIESSLQSAVHKGQRVPSRVIWESRYLNRRMAQDGDSEPWHVITLVREPVARSISAYFQNIERWCPDVLDQSLSQAKKLEIAKRVFFEKYPHYQLLTWFDEKFEPTVGVDVYQTPFPVHKGYKLYEGDRCRVLLIRLENLKTCYAKAFEEFLGISDIPLIPANVAEDKRYAEMYRLFLNDVVFPPSYLDDMYNSKYMRYFYTPEEIAAYRKQWERSSKLNDTNVGSRAVN